MEAAEFETIVTDLRGAAPPRVWSLLVTVFGDLAQDGGAIPAAVLSEITSRIGIKPEAMRVALHRLRKEGWIESRRAGRRSLYALTPEGRTQSIAASPRIYGMGPLTDSAFLVLTNPSETLQLAGVAVWVAPHVALMSKPPQGQGFFVTELSDNTPAPDWMRAKICDSETVGLSSDLALRFKRLETTLGTRTPDPLQAAALRVLIVHSWRRIVLKAPQLPDFVLPEPWAGPECRKRMARLLARLPRPLPETLSVVV